MYTTFMLGACGGKKTTLEPLELEFQMVVDHHAVLAIENSDPLQE